MPGSGISRRSPPFAFFISLFFHVNDTYHCNRILAFRGGSLIHQGLTGPKLITSCHLIWQTRRERGVRFAIPVDRGLARRDRLADTSVFAGDGHARITSRWTSRIFYLHRVLRRIIFQGAFPPPKWSEILSYALSPVCFSSSQIEHFEIFEFLQ